MDGHGFPASLEGRFERRTGRREEGIGIACVIVGIAVVGRRGGYNVVVVSFFGKLALVWGGKVSHGIHFVFVWLLWVFRLLLL